ncbi:tyrosinase central domain-containing protein [Coprinopsis cinerea AmutBmut pab1-1]|nr:tyrosinase central domain-containing protein [Coprinopsis cinerea AmutBmut pab1-1]
MFTSKAVKATLARSRTFRDFWLEVDHLTLGLHAAPHWMVGGEMENVYSSPGEPLFYLHHANVDRIWWKWQHINPAKRLYDIAGPPTEADG